MKHFFSLFSLSRKQKKKPESFKEDVGGHEKLCKVHDKMLVSTTGSFYIVHSERGGGQEDRWGGGTQVRKME